jgi:hypothetical protein
LDEDERAEEWMIRSSVLGGLVVCEVLRCWGVLSGLGVGLAGPGGDELFGVECL